jgi:ABC-type phosphate transport system substrate-binding protein
MRMLTKLLAGGAAVAAVTALAGGPALADPPAGVTPGPASVVSVGANTQQYLSDALAATWDKKFPTKTKLYSWDALNSFGVDNNIKTKSGCASILRPNGASPGIADLAADAGGTTKGHPCIDFARSSRARKSTDPTDISFVAMATDSVTYAALVKGSNAPHNLTAADLTKIYTCQATTWNQVGGKSHAKIHPLLAQSGAGTVTFFLTAIGVTTPGPCVDEPATLEENEGVNPIFKGKNAPNEIIPFSSGLWLAQEYHSAKCLHKFCAPNHEGVVCKPDTSKGQNAFGCDLNGVLRLNDINGTSPTVGKGTKTTLNPKFSLAFVRTLFDVVRGTSIPSYLKQFLGPKGWYCTNPKLIKAYGFLTNPACGTI